jgi:two-component system heavy metal sensor histidine kinase CusS
MRVVLAQSLLSWKDRTLEMRAARVETLISSLPQQREDMIASRLDEIVGILPEGQLIRIVGSDGRQLFPLDTPAASPTLSSGICTAYVIENDRASGGRYRLLCHPIIYGGASASLIVPTSLVENLTLLGNFTSALYKVAPLLLVVSGIGGYSLSRKALRPVASLIREARTITGKNLSRRLPVPQAEDEMRRLALEWNNLLERIEQAVGRVTQFTADASHELRNPIAYIRATAEFNLNTPSLSQDARQGFQDILDETKSTSELLENLLTLARADAGCAPLEIEEVVVDLVIEQVCTRMLPFANDRQHHLIWRSESLSSPTIQINQLHFRRLCMILLDNAIKYTPPGGTVKVVYRFHDGLNLCISDTGVGIAPEHLPHIFERFYRVDAARTEVTQGVGLGLPIAKWLVELYGGYIRIESRPNLGTSVLVHLPTYATG